VVLFKKIATIIQLEWVTAEKAIIFLIEFIKIPPRPPRIAERAMAIQIMLFTWQFDISHRGAIFCQVKIIRICGHSEYWIKLGSHECIGAMAALIISAS